MTRSVGIDLGTTNSVVAAVKASRPVVIAPRSDDRDWTPSLVARADGRMVVGRECETLAAENARLVAHSVKRLMGRKFHDPKVEEMISGGRFSFPVVEHPERPGEIGVQLDGVVLTPPEVAAQVLRSLRDDAATDLGSKVGHAVITVPAYFRDPSIEATREAGRLAGLNVQHTMPEPTAAALAYALGESEGLDGVRHILVYDFGGGTFDVSVLLAAPGASLQVLAVDGDNFLGGDDIDHEIMRQWDREMRTDLGVSILEGTGIHQDGENGLDAIRWTLRFAAREAKERLAGSAPSRSVTRANLIRRDDGTLLSPTWTLTRDVLARIADPRIDRTFEIVDKALAAAGIAAADVHDVVVVGGSTKLSGVLDRLRAHFPQAEIRNSINPMLVVAAGAAQQTRAKLSWTCGECGRTNDASDASCIGCGADAMQPEHDCPECGAIYAASDTVCPNPACATRIVRPDAPVEVLSHTFKVRLADGDWHPIIERGTPVAPSRRQAAAPSPWVDLAAHRTGQGIELPIGQDADDSSAEPTAIATFRVVDPPEGIVAGDRVRARLVLDGHRAASAEVEIGGRLYATTKRAVIEDAAKDDGERSDEVADAPADGGAGFVRFMAAGVDMLPASAANPGAEAFIDELRETSRRLGALADRIDRAAAAGDHAAASRLRSEADSVIDDGFPIVPILSLAALKAHVTEDLEARRDLQAAIERVRQAVGYGNADDLVAAMENLQDAMALAPWPDGDPSGPASDLLIRYQQK